MPHLHSEKLQRSGSSLFTTANVLHYISDHCNLGPDCPWRCEFPAGEPCSLFLSLSYPHEAHPTPNLHPAKLQRSGSSLHTPATIPHLICDHWSLAPDCPWRGEYLGSAKRPCSPGPSPWRNIPCSIPNDQTQQTPEEPLHIYKHPPLDL